MCFHVAGVRGSRWELVGRAVFAFCTSDPLLKTLSHSPLPLKCGLDCVTLKYPNGILMMAKLSRHSFMFILSAAFQPSHRVSVIAHDVLLRAQGYTPVFTLESCVMSVLSGGVPADDNSTNIDIILGASQTLTCLIFTKPLGGRYNYYYYYSHFTGEEKEAQKLSHKRSHPVMWWSQDSRPFSLALLSVLLTTWLLVHHLLNGVGA